jgi:hypothetical protein
MEPSQHFLLGMIVAWMPSMANTALHFCGHPSELNLEK